MISMSSSSSVSTHLSVKVLRGIPSWLPSGPRTKKWMPSSTSRSRSQPILLCDHSDIQRRDCQVPGSAEEVRSSYFPSHLACAQVFDEQEGHAAKLVQEVSLSADKYRILSYISAQGHSGIKANVKAVQGELYFLEKGLIFIAKQPILIDFSKTESISFSRCVMRPSIVFCGSYSLQCRRWHRLGKDL